MPTLKEKQQDLQKMILEAKDFRAELEEREKDGQEVTGEERAKFREMLDAGQALREEIETDVKFAEMEDASKPVDPRRSRQGADPRPVKKSWGQIVIESPEFKYAVDKRAKRMDGVNVKSQHGATDAAGGALVIPDRGPDVNLPERPVSILNLINISQTSVDSVEYAELTTRTDNTAPVKEWDTDLTPDNYGLKPQGALVFALNTVNVQTIAQWIPASRNILMDAPRMRGLIDTNLTYMLRLELEDQILGGNGTAPNFTGILNTSGIQTRTQQSTSDRGGEATDTKADALRRAVTDIRLAFYEPDGIVLNPGDGESIELQKDANGQYIGIYDSIEGRMWRQRVVETPATSAGTAIVGAFMMGATLWDRMQTDIRVGEPSDMFLRNAVAILAELRAAFAVTYPTAFEKVTFA